MSNVHGRFGL